MISLLGYWRGSSTNLLEPESAINQGLHEDFINFLRTEPTTANTVCVFEAVKELILGIPIMYISAVFLSRASRGDTDTS